MCRESDSEILSRSRSQWSDERRGEAEDGEGGKWAVTSLHSGLFVVTMKRGLLIGGLNNCSLLIGWNIHIYKWSFWKHIIEHHRPDLC